MSVKLIAVDVDGTLVADNHLTLPQINVEALREAKKSGIVTVISSGRTLKITEKEIEALKCMDYMVLSNGAAVMNLVTGEVVYHNYLDKESAGAIIDIMEKYPVVYEVYARDAAFVSRYGAANYHKAKLPMEFLEEYITRFEEVSNVKEIIKDYDVEKINVNYVEPEYWDKILEEVKALGNLEFSAGFQGNMEVTAKNADKGYGLKVLCDKLGIEAHEVMAFGDSANDVTMLEYAGMSYAMKNGNDVAKAAAKHITEKTNGEGGVGHTIYSVIGKN